MTRVAGEQKPTEETYDLPVVDGRQLVSPANPQDHNPFGPTPQFKDVPEKLTPEERAGHERNTLADEMVRFRKPEELKTPGAVWDSVTADYRRAFQMHTGVTITPSYTPKPQTPTAETLIPSTRQTISTAKGSVEVGKFNDGKQETWVAIAPRDDGSGFKTYKLDIDPKKNELSEADKERIGRMIDYGYFGKLKPEAKPSSTSVVHKEGEKFDSRPYKGFGRTFQVLNKGVYELWYDPNGAGENQLVWTSKRPLDLSKDLKPRTPLANKLEQIAAPRASAPVPPLEPQQTAPPPVSATSRPTIPRQPSQSQQSFSTLAPLTTLKPA